MNKNKIEVFCTANIDEQKVAAVRNVGFRSREATNTVGEAIYERDTYT